MKTSAIMIEFARKCNAYAKTFNAETKGEGQNLKLGDLISFYEAQNNRVRAKIMSCLNEEINDFKSARESIQIAQTQSHHYTTDSMYHMIKFGLFGSGMAVTADIYNNGIPSFTRFLFTTGAGFVVGSQVANRFFPRESVALETLQTVSEKIKAHLATVKPAVDVQTTDEKEKETKQTHDRSPSELKMGEREENPVGAEYPTYRKRAFSF